MANDELPILRWGIVGCGWISATFVSDLFTGRKNTILHVVKAIGSSSKEKGSDFVAKNCPSQQPIIYDSYDDVYNDPNVDIVYIGTPHVLHCKNALDAIAAGKHVLCEKPFALNSQEVKRMTDAARDKGVFLMEAVWTRFFPLAKKLQSLLHEDKVIGDIHSAFIDFSLYMPIKDAKPGARTALRSLGAGALLDIGFYTLTWASMILDASPSRILANDPKISSSMIFHSETDPEGKVDEQVAVVLTYTDLKAQAVCTASMLHKTPDEFARVIGSKGIISVVGPAASKPSSLIVKVSGQEELVLDFEVPGWGFHYEADAVAEDIKAGRKENQICPLNETLKVMSWMDAARAQCGLVYPQEE